MTWESFHPGDCCTNIILMWWFILHILYTSMSKCVYKFKYAISKILISMHIALWKKSANGNI